MPPSNISKRDYAGLFVLCHSLFERGVLSEEQMTAMKTKIIVSDSRLLEAFQRYLANGRHEELVGEIEELKTFSMSDSDGESKMDVEKEREFRERIVHGCMSTVPLSEALAISGRQTVMLSKTLFKLRMLEISIPKIWELSKSIYEDEMTFDGVESIIWNLYEDIKNRGMTDEINEVYYSAFAVFQHYVHAVHQLLSAINPHGYKLPHLLVSMICILTDSIEEKSKLAYLLLAEEDETCLSDSEIFRLMLCTSVSVEATLSVGMMMASAPELLPHTYDEEGAFVWATTRVVDSIWNRCRLLFSQVEADPRSFNKFEQFSRNKGEEEEYFPFDVFSQSQTNIFRMLDEIAEKRGEVDTEDDLTEQEKALEKEMYMSAENEDLEPSDEDDDPFGDSFDANFDDDFDANYDASDNDEDDEDET